LTSFRNSIHQNIVEVKLIAACSHSPASSLPLTQGVGEAIKRYCPENQRVIVTESAVRCVLSVLTKAITALAEVPQGRLLAMKIEGKSLILT
jgi:Fe-S cluster biogenesis protein NfuA